MSFEIRAPSWQVRMSCEVPLRLCVFFEAEVDKDRREKVLDLGKSKGVSRKKFGPKVRNFVYKNAIFTFAVLLYLLGVICGRSWWPIFFLHVHEIFVNALPQLLCKCMRSTVSSLHSIFSTLSIYSHLKFRSFKIISHFLGERSEAYSHKDRSKWFGFFPSVTSLCVSSLQI